MSEKEFLPIRLTGCDEAKVRRTSQAKNQYLFPFTLSAKPPKDWEERFDDLWRARRKQSRTKATVYVHKGALVLECPLADLAARYDELRADVQAANEKYAGQRQEEAEKEAKKKRKREEEKQAERSAIHAALQQLDFS